MANLAAGSLSTVIALAQRTAADGRRGSAHVSGLSRRGRAAGRVRRRVEPVMSQRDAVAASRPRPSRRWRSRAGWLAAALALVLVFAARSSWHATADAAQRRRCPSSPSRVNDFADVVDAGAARRIDRLIGRSSGGERRRRRGRHGADDRALRRHPRVRGQAVREPRPRHRQSTTRSKDNGLLILLAVKERRVWVEVGYDLEQWITDGFAGETSREVMVPQFRNRQLRRGPAERDGADRRPHRRRAATSR